MPIITVIYCELQRYQHSILRAPVQVVHRHREVSDFIFAPTSCPSFAGIFVFMNGESWSEGQGYGRLNVALCTLPLGLASRSGFATGLQLNCSVKRLKGVTFEPSLRYCWQPWH